jgi:hypothetical protein
MAYYCFSIGFSRNQALLGDLVALPDAVAPDYFKLQN